MQIRRWHNLPDAAELERAVLADIVASAAAAIAARGVFQIVLAGGTTPQFIYERLRAINTDWHAWSIYFGDERCLPCGDNQRNDGMACSAWLDHVPIPRAQIYSIPAQLGATVGAAQYSATLAAVGAFDLVLLGLGEDGHTASLFPGDTAALTATTAAVAVTHAPKPPAERISLSVARLGWAHRVLFLVSGASKRPALLRWQRGEAIPASLIAPANGVDIYTDIASV